MWKNHHYSQLNTHIHTWRGKERQLQSYIRHPWKLGRERWQSLGLADWLLLYNNDNDNDVDGLVRVSWPKRKVAVAVAVAVSGVCYKQTHAHTYTRLLYQVAGNVVVFWKEEDIQREKKRIGRKKNQYLMHPKTRGGISIWMKKKERNSKKKSEDIFFLYTRTLTSVAQLS